MKIKITPRARACIPGFDGLNVTALRKDGWTGDLVVDADPVEGRSVLCWQRGSTGGMRWGVLLKGEYVEVEECRDTLSGLRTTHRT